MNLETIQSIAMNRLALDLEKAGLKLEENFRVCDEGMALTHAAVAVMKSTGFPLEIPGNDTIKGMGIDRDGGFFHPLTETFSEEESGEEGGALNIWGAASMLVSSALGWMDADKPENALAVVRESALSVAPTVSIPDLMFAARYSDAELLRLVGLVREGLQQSCNKVFNQ